MKSVAILFLVFVLSVQLVGIYSAPITLIAGTPFLFHKFDYKVDPNRGAELSPAFQAQYGPLGEQLVASFGTGQL